MELTMSMFASSADYWKTRAELAERTVLETAEALGCVADNEAMLDAARCAGRYRALRRGQKWSVINGIGDTLRGDALDADIDAAAEGAGGFNAGNNAPPKAVAVD